MSTTNEPSDLTCYICKKVYTNPCVISPCGHSFDRECIARCAHCPMPKCNAPVYANTLAPNYVLQNLVDNYHRRAESIYEIFLLDTSSSMWYSDYFIGLFGSSRFRVAIEFLTEIFEQRWNSTTNKISLITFDTNPIEHFPFETAREQHVKQLQALRPNGPKTALFDAIKFSLEKFERLKLTTTRSTSQYLYILTDGGDNFSASGNEKHYIDYIKKNSGKLNIIGHIIQVGDKNLDDTKRLCDQLDYHFYHFNNGNAPQFVNSFLSSSNYQVTDIEQTINALPDAWSQPVQHAKEQLKTAAYA